MTASATLENYTTLTDVTKQNASLGHPSLGLAWRRPWVAEAAWEGGRHVRRGRIVRGRRGGRRAAGVPSLAARRRQGSVPSIRITVIMEPETGEVGRRSSREQPGMAGADKRGLKRLKTLGRAGKMAIRPRQFLHGARRDDEVKEAGRARAIESPPNAERCPARLPGRGRWPRICDGGP